MGLLKDTSDAIGEHDIVVIYQAGKAAFFARIEEVTFNKNDECGQWWNVTFNILTLPMKSITWILDDNHLNGAEFSMGGVLYYMDPVLRAGILAPVLVPAETAAPKQEKVFKPGRKVIPLKPEFAKYCPDYEE